ncbi:TetR family transcriptional regulator [Amycolatopsis sp. GM8]|uniref:acyl-CoA-like ligand-binding transcription factor n=1 Tax=Amycolatopsis sp. GM8 TaxID=2896530 RepID=UPI001F026775|nr:TetR family transcriptional regulator [Amycolatopsis sp. GM8]
MKSSQAEPGLRERKKARTRAAIQDAALRLFMAQGYDETTIEQIAAAADISQSTFFRYFPTKEDTVRYDRLDPVLIRSFLRQPAELPPIAAIRKAIDEVYSGMRAEESELELARQRLVFSVPELRALLMDQMAEGIGMLDEAIAQRLGRDVHDLAVQTWSGILVGLIMSAYFASREDPDRLMDEFGKRLACFEAGLPE